MAHDGAIFWIFEIICQMEFRKMGSVAGDLPDKRFVFERIKYSKRRLSIF